MLKLLSYPVIFESKEICLKLNRKLFGILLTSKMFRLYRHNVKRADPNAGQSSIVIVPVGKGENLLHYIHQLEQLGK